MGMPSPSWDMLVREAAVAARRRRRRRFQRRMLWLLTGVTTAVLVVIGLLIHDIAKVPAQTRPAALSKAAHTASPGTVAGAARRVTPTSPRKTVAAAPTYPTYPTVSDVTSGLTYRRLGSPWQPGCPSNLNTSMFDWTAGENTVAGHVSIGGSVIDWHGLACSGLLQQQFSYAGPADLEPTAMGVADALDSAYYAGVQHSRTTKASKPLKVSGHHAWQVEFAMDYPDGASQGLTWSSELGAVVLVDLGAGQAPAVFYVSVPASLGSQNVSRLVSSLRLGT
jgi:hypothetical protein